MASLSVTFLKGKILFSIVAQFLRGRAKSSLRVCGLGRLGAGGERGEGGGGGLMLDFRSWENSASIGRDGGGDGSCDGGGGGRRRRWPRGGGGGGWTVNSTSELAGSK